MRSPAWVLRWLPSSSLKVSAVCRNLLCNLVRVKLSCYQMEKQCSLSVEDYLKAFLETEVKPLWPKGWMQARWVRAGGLSGLRLVGSSLGGPEGAPLG